jgi:acyl-CoA reductase-like NAD-dependent aldehyde dehydrogenase
VYVHESCFDDFVHAAVQATRKLVVGSKRDEATDVGPLVTEAEARRVESWVVEAAAQGAIIRTGGTRVGAFVHPTILTDVKPGSTVLTEEIFGPVVSILPFASVEEAVRQANDSAYALQAGVFTQSIDTGFNLARELVAGAVVINGTSDLRIDAMPFGGFKSSGIGREGVRFAVEAMTEPKNVIVNVGR